MSRLDQDALSIYRAQQLEKQQQFREPQGGLADVVDVVQKGLYDGAAGIGETFGLDSLRDYGVKGAAEQLKTISPQGQASMNKQFFNEDSQGTLTPGEAWTDPMAIVMQIGHTIGLNADIMLGGAAIKGGTLAVTSVAKAARNTVLQKTGRKELADAAAAKASETYLQRKLGDRAGEFASFGKDILAYGAAGHAVSGGLQALDIGNEVESMDFEDLAASPEFAQLVRENKQLNPGVGAEELLTQSRSQLAEMTRTAIKTNPALLTSNLLVGGLGTAALQRILTGAMPKGAGIAAEFGTEAAQGGIEQMAQNQTVRDYIDPTQQWDEGMTAAALNEGIVGAGMGATAAAVRPAIAKGQELYQKLRPEQTPAAEPAPTAEQSPLPPLTDDDEAMFEPVDPVRDPQGAFIKTATEASKTHPHLVDVIGEIAFAEPEKMKAAVSTLDNFMASPDFANRTMARLTQYMRDPQSAAAPDQQEQQDLQNLVGIIGRQNEEMAAQLSEYAQKNPEKTPLALSVASRYIAEPDFRPKAEAQIAQHLAQQNQPVVPAAEPAQDMSYEEDDPEYQVTSAQLAGTPTAWERDEEAFSESVAADEAADREFMTELDAAKKTAQQAPLSLTDPRIQPAMDAQKDEAEIPAPAPAVSSGDAFKDAATYIRSLPIDERGKVAPDMLKDTFGIDDAQVLELMPWAKLSTETVGNSEKPSEIKAKIDEAATTAALSPANDLPEPTPAQKDAGNYKKAHVRIHGLDVAIENPAGSKRTGTNAKGEQWSVDMQDHYGYIKRTEGADGDHVDVFIGKNPDSQKVFVVDQYKGDGTFDEHKVVLGADSMDDAVQTYSRNYSAGWNVGPVTEMSVDDFKKWLATGNTKAPMMALDDGPLAEHGPLRIEPYSEKSIVVRGDTKAYKDQLKNLKGTFNPRLKGGEGWVFSKSRLDELNRTLPGIVAKQTRADENAQLSNAPAAEQDDLFTKAQKRQQELASRTKDAAMANRIRDLLPATRDASFDAGRVAGELDKFEKQIAVQEKRDQLKAEREKSQGKNQAGSKTAAPKTGDAFQDYWANSASESVKNTPPVNVNADSPKVKSDESKGKAVSEPAQKDKEQALFDSYSDEDVYKAIVYARQGLGGKNGLMATKVRDLVDGAWSKFIVNREGVKAHLDDALSKQDPLVQQAFADVMKQVLPVASEYVEKDAVVVTAPSAPAQSKLDATAKTISDKKIAAAEKLAALIKSRKGQLNSGIDPEVMLAVAEVGALSIAEGAVKFAQWVRDVMVTTRAVGIADDDVKPFLKEAYGAIANNPEKYGVADDLADAMDSAKDVRKTDIAAILNEDAQAVTEPLSADDKSGIAVILNDGVKAEDLLRWIEANSDNESYKAIARRISKAMPDGIDVMVVSSGQQLRKAIPSRMNISRGMYWERNGEKTLILKDDSFEENGMNEETVLHELLHAATMRKIIDGNKTSTRETDPKLHAAVKSLFELQNQVVDYINKNKEVAASLSFTDQNAVSSVDELIAWGLTNAKFQELLTKIPVNNTSAWSKFTQIIAKILGVKDADETALSELLRATSTLFDAIDGQGADTAVLNELTEGTTDEATTKLGEPDQGRVSKAGRGRKSSAQSGAAQANPSELESGQLADGKNAGTGGDSGQDSIRDAGENVSGNGRADSSGDASNRRPRTSGKKSSDVGSTSTRVTPKKPETVSPANPGVGNFHLNDPLAVVGGSPVKRFERNKAAIELYNMLRDEDRLPTAEEQTVLAGYSGWGSFGQELFQGTWARKNPKSGWEERDAWLREHLGQSEWEGLQRSITNSHYTDPPTVMAMWDMVRRMGFQGGRVLEPSIGVGNFFAMMPKDLKDRSQLAGIELDPLTGGIAQKLYPDANIQIKGYQDSKTPDNFYDLIIGNWPFENTPIADRRYNRFTPMLHDYFFLKTLDQVRPGGLVIGITSKGSLDKKSAHIRTEMAKKAELVAAFRLPSGAFEQYAGTSVVTDIVILRKRTEPIALVAGEGWIQTAEVKTPSGEPVEINEYYAKNPGHVIGTVDYGFGTTSNRPGLIVRRPDDMETQLQRVINLVPENAYQADSKVKQIAYITNHLKDREGSLVESKGSLFVVHGEYLAPANEVIKYELKAKDATAVREAQLKAAIALRQDYARLIEAETGATDGDTDSLRKALKKAYDGFVKEYGNLSESFALQYLKKLNDPFYPSLAALEDTQNGKVKPAAIFKESTIRTRQKVVNPSVADAFVLARNESVNPSLARIAELANKSPEQVKQELLDKKAVFELPNGDVVPTDIYLSGNVRQKMREARAALQDGNAAMAVNVEALQSVMPADIPYFNIEVQMGASWIPKKYYAQYVAHMLNLKDAEGIDVTYKVGRWKVDIEKKLMDKPESSTGFGTKVYSFKKLVNAAFSNQTVTIRYTDETGATFVHQEHTQEVNGKIAEIRSKFQEWIWADAERKLDIEQEYNEARNAYATPKFDGSFLSFQGMALQLGNGPFNLRQHQANAIWRALVTRKSLNAHEVGTGKTFTMAGIAVESRRYGLAKKPMILAHNANSKTVAAEMQMMYPAAKVLYIDNLKPSEIAIRMRQIANDDWDAVILPHSLISHMTLDEKTLMSMAQEEIDAIMAEAYDAAQEDGVEITRAMLEDDKELGKLRSATAKELVKLRNRIIENIKKQSQRATKDGAVTFEQLGIDMILVDEAHEFKKPPFATRMRMKGLNAQASDKSIALNFLTKYIRANNGGGNVHLFTGTPVTNTLTEVFHMQRYIMNEEMAADDVDQWDGWFGSFAREVMDIELNAAAEYEAVTRLAGFINVPELRQMLGQYMDIVFADDMPEMQPRKTASGKTLSDPSLTDAERDHLLNGRTEGAKDRPYKKIINETSDLTVGQQSAFEDIQGYARSWREMTGKQRKEAMRSGAPESPIIYENLAAKASFDVRLMDGEANAGKEGQLPDDPNSKASKVIRNVLDIYRGDKRATQVIFMQQGISKTATRSVGPAGNKYKETYKVFSTAYDIIERLVQAGIPREQIALVDGSTDKAKRKAIADAMNKSEIRVVLGSSQSLGVGVNMQKNLRAMHHMDAPWMPGDLEQRNGRGHRQGNQWNTVLEYRYLTDRIDGRRWQVLAVKDKFIKAFLKGNTNVRVIEGDAASDEDSDILQSFSEAAGDPRILIRTKLQKKLEQLQRKKRLHDQGIYDALQAAKSARSQLDTLRDELDALQENDIAGKVSRLSQQKAGKGFGIQIDGKTYQDRKEAQEAIDFLIAAKLNRDSKSITIGQFGEYALRVDNANPQEWRTGDTAPKLELVVDGEVLRSKTQSLQSLEATVRNYPEQVAKKQTRVDELRRSIDRAMSVSKEPFQAEKQLASTEKELKELELDINMNPVAPPAWLRSGAPIETIVHWGGNTFEVTGHRWNNSGWYVLAKNDSRSVQIPYLEVKDEQGMAVYDEREFIEPDLVGKNAKPEQKTQDADLIDVPASFGPVTGRNAMSNAPRRRHVGERPELSKIQALADFFDSRLADSGTGTQVVEEFSDLAKHLPPEVLSRVSPKTDAFLVGSKVYMIAKHIPDLPTAQELMVHERLRHFGVRRLFGDAFWAKMQKLAFAVGPKQLRRLGEKYGMNVNQYLEHYQEIDHPFPEAALLDEVIAHIKKDQVPTGIWQEIKELLAMFRAKLRDWGFGEWLDKFGAHEAEIMRVLKMAKAQVTDKGPQPPSPTTKADDFDAPAMLSKSGNPVIDKVSAINAERLQRWAQVFKPSKIVEAAKVKWPDLRPAMLQMIPRNYLADIGGHLLPSLRRYNAQVAQMEAQRNDMLSEVHETADKWRKMSGKNAAASAQFADLLHESTLVGVDPSLAEFVPSMTDKVYQFLMNRAKAFIKSRNGEAEAVARGMERRRRIQAAYDRIPTQREAYVQLRQQFLAMPAEYQALFTEVRDSYQAMNAKRKEAIEKRIEDLIADKRVSAAHIVAMREEFEEAELNGFYVPLQRFGKHYATAKDAETGQLLAYSQFETNAEMLQWMEEQRMPGVDVQGGYKYEYSKAVDGVSQGFVKDLLLKFGPQLDKNNSLQNDLYQLMLDHMPDLSIRKHMIHRKGVAGYSADALRAFAHNQFHTAYQIAKISHTHHMQSHILAMHDEEKLIKDTNDKKIAVQVINELQQRNEWILNPKGSEWANHLTGWGFLWYLGVSPAAALVNITQTAMVGLPVIGARYGFKETATMLGRVSKAFITGKGNVDNTLKDRELNAFRELERSGIIDKTMAHDLTGIADGGVAYRPRYHLVMKYAGWMFHHAERFNREVTAMAAYRLAFNKFRGKHGEGLAHNLAIAEAIELTRLSHFDYANSNRPRFMQGDVARVILLFRQHSINMSYRLIRDFQQSFWGKGEDKKIAQRQLAGMLGMTVLLAGAAGLPLYSVVAGIFNTMLDDEDEPFDFDKAVRETLSDAIGETAASVIMSGTPGTALNVDLTNRIGMNNLWIRDPEADVEGEAAVQYYAEQALGPMYGILAGWGKAATLAREGHTGRAWESAVPKFARDWFKTVRYADEGVNTKRGDPILDDVSPWHLALTFNGFTPLDLSDQYRENNALSTAQRRLRDRRKLLLNRYALARRLDDGGAVADALLEIDAFNLAQPTLKISPADRVKSLKQRQRLSQQAVNGVILDKKLASLAE